MRKLPLLLVLLLLGALLAAAASHASFAPGAQAPALVASDGDEPPSEEDGDEESEDEGEEPEDCVIEDDEDVQLCAEIAREERESEKAGQCVLEDADAAVIANPGRRRLRLRVHYRTSKPATVAVEATLRGPRGTIRLGTGHARFRRSGVYRDSFDLAAKQMKKALLATEFAVALHVLKAPPECGVELTGASPRARR